MHAEGVGGVSKPGGEKHLSSVYMVSQEPLDGVCVKEDAELGGSYSLLSLAFPMKLS